MDISPNLLPVFTAPWRFAVFLLFLAALIALYDIYYIVRTTKMSSRRKARKALKERYESLSWYEKYIHNDLYTVDFRYDEERGGWILIHDNEPALFQKLWKKYAHHHTIAQIQRHEVAAKKKSQGASVRSSYGRGMVESQKRYSYWDTPKEKLHEHRAFDEGEVLDISKLSSSCAENLQEEANEIITALFIKSGKA